MAVPSSSPSKYNKGSVKEEEMKIMKESEVTEKAKRSKCPGIRVVGGRIYDSRNGKTCHQCRQKTMDFTAACKNLKKNKQCTIRYCHKCLLNRYGEKAEEVELLDDWKCPKCRGICNCSFCMKKRGHKPTGILVHAAKATGFSSVSEMLNVKGTENGLVIEIGVSPKKPAASEKDFVAASPRKPGKENSFDRNCDSNLNSRNLTPTSNEKKSKKMKREGLKEFSNSNSDDDASLRKGSSKRLKTSEEISTNGEGTPKKPKISENISKKEVKKNGKDRGGVAEKKNSKTQDSKGFSSNSVEEEENDGANRKEAGDSNDVKKNDAGVKLKAPIKSHKVKRCTMELQNIEFDADIQLPTGTCLTAIAGVELLPEQVGDALQFLEFCAAFGEVLDIKKGQAESVIRELVRGRSRSRGQYSSLVQIHIQLLSLIEKDLIQTDMGKKCPSLSPTSDKNSWLHALGKCVSKSQYVSKDFPSDCFAGGGDGYDKLDTSKKLKLLNFLCDEAICTDDLRSWIGGHKLRTVEREKEAKERVNAAKDKEKQLKQKRQGEVAKAIIAKNGAPLSVAEHEAVISQIKSEAAKAHAEMLEAVGMLPKKRQSDAMRTEPILLDVNGRAFWRLKGHTGGPDVLLQDMEPWDAVAPNEKWFAYDAEQKQEIEKYISFLRTKMLMVPKVADPPLSECNEIDS